MNKEWRELGAALDEMFKAIVEIIALDVLKLAAKAYDWSQS